MKIKWKLNHVMYIYYNWLYLYSTILYEKNTVKRRMIYDIKGKLWNNYKLLRLSGQNKQDVVCYPRYGKDNLSKNRIKLPCLCK